MRFNAMGTLPLTTPEMESIASIQSAGSLGAQAAATVRATIDSGTLPAYPVIAGVWVSLVGETVPILRFLSVLLGVFALLGVAAVARIIAFSPAVWWCVLALTLVSPFYQRFGVRAGSEALALAMISWSSWALLKSLIDPRTRYWVCYVLAVSIGVLSHPIFVSIAIGQALFALWQLTNKRLTSRAAMWVIGTLIGAFSIASPWRAAFANALTVIPTKNIADVAASTPGGTGLLLQNIGAIFVAAPMLLSLLVAALSLIALIGFLIKAPPAPRAYIVCVGALPLLLIAGVDWNWGTGLLMVPFNVAPFALVLVTTCGAWLVKGLASAGTARIVTVVVLLALIAAGSADLQVRS